MTGSRSCSCKVIETGFKPRTLWLWRYWSFFSCILFLNFYLFYFLNWGIVDLQCFGCTVKLFSYTYRHTHILFQILFHYRLLQGIEYSSLYYIIGPCCLSMLYIVVCICWSQIPNLSLPHLSPLVTINLFSMCVSLFLVFLFVFNTFIYLFIYLFIFVCVGSSLLHAGFL